MARSPLKLSIKDLLAKISAQDLLDYQSEHHATTRAIWQAQSAERVARAIWKWARRHNQSYLAGLKWRDGCASTCLNFTTHCTHHKKWRLKMMFCLGFGKGLLSTAPATENEPETPEVPRLPHRIITMSKIKKVVSFTKRDLRPFQNFVQGHQILRLPHEMTAKTTCHFYHCLSHACHRFSNAQKAPRLPHGQKCARCPAPVKQNNALDLKMSQRCHTCHTEWT